MEFEEENEKELIQQQSCNSKSSESRVCRICFDGEYIEKALIYPCHCTGTMKFIHEECLKLWILTQKCDIQNYQCDICKTKLKMETIYKQKLSFKNLNRECLKIIIFPIVICLIGSVFGIVMLYFVAGLISDSLQTSEKVYLVIVLITCLLMLCTLLYTLVHSIKSGCFLRQLVSWRIFSLAEPLGDSFTQTVLTETYIKESFEHKNPAPNMPNSQSRPYELMTTTLQRAEDVSFFIRRSQTTRSVRPFDVVPELESLTPRLARDLPQH
jgi:hypothetical protein